MKLRAAHVTLGVILAGTALSAAPAEAPRELTVPAGSLPFVRTTDERFQSFQIGMSHLTGGETWRAYDPTKQGKAATTYEDTREVRKQADLSSPRLRRLTAALAPLYIRYGGTTTNSVFFQDNDAPAPAKAPDGFSVVLTRAGWKRGIDFAQAVGAKIVTGFTVSSGVRNASGGWTPSEAAPWLAYTRRAGGSIYAAELMNEPNAPDPKSFTKGQDPATYAADFAAFSTFMRKAAPQVRLVGPGLATLGVTVPSFGAANAELYLTANPAPKFDILSYHFYGAIADRCAPANSPMGISPDKALSEEWLKRPDVQLQQHKALRDRYAPGAPLWLTETGAAACGGTPWQPTFIDTFRYLDANARLARSGLDAIFTHALISGSNGVIDEKTFLPNADYWAALLWRRVMGARVLDAGPTLPGLHIYAHCLRGTPGGVALLAINLANEPATIRTLTAAQVFSLTAPELLSHTVLLNGHALALTPDDRVPAIAPAILKTGAVTLVPASSTFIALPSARNASCGR